MIKQLVAVLSMHAISDRLCSIVLSVWIGKPHKVLHISFSSTESGTSPYHLPFHSRWKFLNSSQWIFFATLPCLHHAKLGQVLMFCATLSTCWLQNQQSGVSLVLSMLYFTELVLIACSCAVQRRLSVSLFSSPFPNHSHYLLSLWVFVSMTNCLSSFFSLHSFNYQCTFPSWVQLLQSWLGTPYYVLHHGCIIGVKWQLFFS